MINTKRRILAIIMIFPILFLCSCASKNVTQKVQTNSEVKSEMQNEKKIELQISSTVLTATLNDNSSAEEFYTLLKNGDITIKMHDYDNFEKVGNLPQNITKNDEQITTQAGDIILYQGNKITIYYDTNSWNFTRLGKIDNVSEKQLKNILGKGDVSVTFRLLKEKI